LSCIPGYVFYGLSNNCIKNDEIDKKAHEMVNKINTKLRTHLGQHECMLQSEGYLNFTEIQKFISD